MDKIGAVNKVKDQYDQSAQYNYAGTTGYAAPSIFTGYFGNGAPSTNTASTVYN